VTGKVNENARRADLGGCVVKLKEVAARADPDDLGSRDVPLGA
jgi:hypothetical protein